MLTSDDGGPDGRKRRYLTQPEAYRNPDPELFDALLELTRSPALTVSSVEESPILPGALFYPPVLTDSGNEREMYFRELWTRAPSDSIIFFDPDNGLEIKSCPKGRKNSAKYLYLDELEAAGQESRSVLVYQHFGRVARAAYIPAQMERVASALPGHQVFAISGSHIAFLVAATAEHAPAIWPAMKDLSRRWPRLAVATHSSESP